MATSITTWIAMQSASFAADPMLSDYIAAAAEQIDVRCWGDKYNQGVALLACHYMQMASDAASGGGAAAGPVTSRKAGDVSIGYGAGSSSSVGAGYDLTTYGQRFVGLRDSLACTGPMLATPWCI